jgi:hypothetical protein
VPQRETLGMIRFTHQLHNFIPLVQTLLRFVGDAARFLWLCLHPPAALNLFLRQQLALYCERDIKARRAPDTTQTALVWLSRWFDWRQALIIVQPATLIRSHRLGFRVFRQWQSRPGRPPILADLQALIRRMAWENLSWGQERISHALRVCRHGTYQPPHLAHQCDGTPDSAMGHAAAA